MRENVDLVMDINGHVRKPFTCTVKARVGGFLW